MQETSVYLRSEKKKLKSEKMGIGKNKAQMVSKFYWGNIVGMINGSSNFLEDVKMIIKF